MKQMIKVCSQCKKKFIGILDIDSSFYKDKRTKDGYMSRCKNCEKEYRKKPRIKLRKPKKNMIKNIIKKIEIR